MTTLRATAKVLPVFPKGCKVRHLTDATKGNGRAEYSCQDGTTAVRWDNGSSNFVHYTNLVGVPQ